MVKIQNGIFLGILLVLSLFNVNTFSAEQPIFQQSLKLRSIFMVHEPISIGSNNDFILQGYNGSGTKENPFRIENLNITATGGRIHVLDVTAFFVIQNCILDGITSSEAGILFQNVRNGVIANNTITRSGGGIMIQNSEDILVFDNEITNNVGGILVEGSLKTNITYNNIHHNSFNGIDVRLSENTNIMFNEIYNNSDEGGIGIGPNANNGLIANNIFYDNNNAIKIGASENNTVEHNDFANNGLGFLSQASDEDGVSEFSHNYWTDWGGNGQYDITSINNPSIYTNYDSSPLTSANHITPPTIQTPSNDGSAEIAVISGIIEIRWSAATDPFDHDFTYSLFYSTEQDGLWIPIVNGISTNNYTLDTLPITDGSDLFLMVIATDEFGFSSQFILDDSFMVGNSVHELSKPNILSPSFEATLGGEIEISWTMSADTWEANTVYYSLYFISQNDTTWKPIVSNLVSTSYIWDTSDIENGLYVIKVSAICSGGLWAESASNISFTIQNLPDEENGPKLPVPFPGIQTIGIALISLPILRRKIITTNN